MRCFPDQSPWLVGSTQELGKPFHKLRGLRNDREGASPEMLFPLTVTRLSPTLALTKSPV